MTSLDIFFLFFFISFHSNAQSLNNMAVPKLNEEYWNLDLDRKVNNNCYNYATNRATNSYARPGEAGGVFFGEISCENVIAAATADLGLAPTSYFEYTAKSDDTLIALVVNPGYDFHWYRRDDNGLWSHKMGGSNVQLYDNSGRLIQSPETADRGPYSEFCGYLRIKNYIDKSHEQNAGYVRIGNMTNLPDLEMDEKYFSNFNQKKSRIIVLMYSGQKNKEFVLSEILNDAQIKAELLEIKSRLNLIKVTKEESLKDPANFIKLGYRGILIDDSEGLLFEKNTFITIKDLSVQGNLANVHKTFFLELKNKLKLEEKLLFSLE